MLPEPYTFEFDVGGNGATVSVTSEPPMVIVRVEPATAPANQVAPLHEASYPITMSLPNPTPAEISASRAAMNLTQGQCAALIAMSADSWSKRERGATKMEPEEWALWLLLSGQHQTHRIVSRW